MPTALGLVHPLALLNGTIGQIVYHGEVIANSVARSKKRAVPPGRKKQIAARSKSYQFGSLKRIPLSFVAHALAVPAMGEGGGKVPSGDEITLT